VNFRDVGLGFAGQCPKRLQAAGDVFERHCLQFCAPLQRLQESTNALRRLRRPADGKGSGRGRNR
jgi:hypothetical protein